MGIGREEILAYTCRLMETASIANKDLARMAGTCTARMAGTCTAETILVKSCSNLRFSRYEFGFIGLLSIT